MKAVSIGVRGCRPVATKYGLRAEIRARYILAVVRKLNKLDVLEPAVTARTRRIHEIPQSLANVTVHPLCIVALRMHWRSVAQLDPPKPTKLLQQLIVELRAIVGQHCTWRSPFQQDATQENLVNGFCALVGNDSRLGLGWYYQYGDF